MSPTAPNDLVVLVDQADRPTGTGEKLAVHRAGWLHRAFSVFVFDAQGRLLLQRRAAGKYHSGGLWSNTCCGHPRPGEATMMAAGRRLREEMGVECPLEAAGAFLYRAALRDGLIEHEYDHVFVGWFNGTPEPNPTEVGEWRWVTLEELVVALRRDPSAYTAWLQRALELVQDARPSGRET